MACTSDCKGHTLRHCSQGTRGANQFHSHGFSWMGADRRRFCQFAAVRSGVHTPFSQGHESTKSEIGQGRECMSENVTASSRIPISGSATMGKTSLTSALANNLGLAWIREEMREYLESSRANLSELPPAQVGSLLMRLWGERKQREANAPGFIADNCSLDFAAYALYYGCLDSENASVLLSETVEHIGSYDAIFVLPWGVLPYNHDGIRPPNQYLQLRYQLIVEGLLQRYTPSKVHYIPESIVDLS